MQNKKIFVDSPSGETPVVEPSGATAVAGNASPQDPSKPKKKRKGLLWVLVVCMVLVAFGVAIWMFNREAKIYPPAQIIKDAVTDIDGNTYDAVQIGKQMWMAENMRATRDCDGNEIAIGSENTTRTPYRYCPNDDPKNVEKYGYLYNWEAAKRVCPKGWHLPTDDEWKQLEMAAGMSQTDADKSNDWRGNIAANLCGDDGWNPSFKANAAGNKSASGRNATGFSALPAGFYLGTSDSFGDRAYFWSTVKDKSSSLYGRYLHWRVAGVYRYDAHKYYGFSVRCVRD